MNSSLKIGLANITLFLLVVVFTLFNKKMVGVLILSAVLNLPIGIKMVYDYLKDKKC